MKESYFVGTSMFLVWNKSLPINLEHRPDACWEKKDFVKDQTNDQIEVGFLLHFKQAWQTK